MSTLAPICIQQNNHVIDHTCVSKDLRTGCRFYTSIMAPGRSNKHNTLAFNIQFVKAGCVLLWVFHTFPSVYWTSRQMSPSDLKRRATFQVYYYTQRWRRQIKDKSPCSNKTKPQASKTQICILMMKNKSFARFPPTFSFVYISQLFSSYQQREMIRLAVVWTTWELPPIQHFLSIFKPLMGSECTLGQPNDLE